MPVKMLFILINFKEIVQIKQPEDELPSIPAINTLSTMEKKGIILVSYANLQCPACKHNRKIKDISGISVFSSVNYKCSNCGNAQMTVLGIYSEFRMRRRKK